MPPDAGRYALAASEPPRQKLPSQPDVFRVPRPTSLAPSTKPQPFPEQARRLWPEIEVALYEGKRDQAIAYLERSATQAVRELSAAERQDVARLAQKAAELLTRSWITHHFAPFDTSLHSLGRLELALDVAYGRTKRGVSVASQGFCLLLGAYLGETLRLSHRGTWQGELQHLPSLRVRAGTHVWHPFTLISERLTAGGTITLTASVEPGLAKHGTQAWLAHRPAPMGLPALWSSLPNAGQMPEWAAALCHSTLSLACAQQQGIALDRSEDSLSALDFVLDTLVASASPLSATEVWLERLAILVGAYTGEILRMQLGGEWQVLEGVPTAERYLLRFPSGLEATPVANVVSRALARKGSQLAGYARALMRRSLDAAH
jgi:hypothetical protein